MSLADELRYQASISSRSGQMAALEVLAVKVAKLEAKLAQLEKKS